MSAVILNKIYQSAFKLLMPLTPELTYQTIIEEAKNLVGADSGSMSSFFSELNITYGYEVKKQLYEAAKDDNIKAVVLEINSPGGTIYGSQAIAEGVAYYQSQTHKPVYSFVSGLAASGGYWAAIASNKVYADHGTSMGSIGVITGPFKYFDEVVSEQAGLLGGGVITQKGIDTFYISAGEYKDLGNPYRKMTADEISALQDAVSNEYDTFVDHVAEHRDIKSEVVRKEVKALVYDTKRALALHLIDAVANREETYHALAEQAGISDSYQVQRAETPASLLTSLLGVITEPTPLSIQSLPICNTAPVILAYHGDILELCKK